MAFADAIKGGVGWLEVGIRQKANSHITADIECHERLGGLMRYHLPKAAGAVVVRLVMQGRALGWCSPGAESTHVGLNGGFVVT